MKLYVPGRLHTPQNKYDLRWAMQSYEHITLTEFLNVNQLLYNSEYGFRKVYSTETATLEVIDILLQTLDKTDIPISIFFNLSKAFDVIDYNILYIKLRLYGISGVPVNWLINYLTGRQQFMKLDVEISNTLPISTGVPDCSTLVSTVSAFKQNTCAPDCKLLSENINFELTRINEWFALNKLNLNISKTKYIIFHYPQRNMALFNLELKL